MSGNFIKGYSANREGSDQLDIYCKYAKGLSSEDIKDEMHSYSELLFLISGDVELISEYGQQKIPPYSLIVIPSNTYHKFNICEDKESYHRVVFGYKNIPELNSLIKMKIKNLTVLKNEKITELFMSVTEIFKKNFTECEKNAFIKSIFALILINIDENDTVNHDSGKESINPIVKKTIEHINENIDKPLNISEIAKKLLISYSCLTKTFKKEMNVSVYKFILSKRLSYARKRITEGANPTEVAIECGFNDYSGFYKQYKKTFGISPSSSVKNRNFDMGIF